MNKEEIESLVGVYNARYGLTENMRDFLRRILEASWYNGYEVGFADSTNMKREDRT